MRRLAIALSVCGVVHVSAIGMQLISVSDEIALGKQAQRQVKKEVPELTDQQVVGYVQSIGRRLVARVSRDTGELRPLAGEWWGREVIDDPPCGQWWDVWVRWLPRQDRRSGGQDRYAS